MSSGSPAPSYFNVVFLLRDVDPEGHVSRIVVGEEVGRRDEDIDGLLGPFVVDAGGEDASSILHAMHPEQVVLDAWST